MADETETRIEGERAETPTARPAENQLAKRGLVVLAVVAFMGFAAWSLRSGTPPANDAPPERVVQRQTRDFEPAKPEPQPAVQPVLPVPLPTPMEPQSAPVTDELLDSARRAPVMAFGGGSAGSSSRRDATPVDADESADGAFQPFRAAGFGGQGQAENEDQRFNRMLTPTQLEGSRAGYLGNRNFIVAMGTSIPCVLETAMASDQPGFVSCVINRDILSDNGRVVLMEKGTQIVGEYRGGLRRGQNRLFVLWNRAKTPTGVIVTLASPATDALGRAGFDGHVDTHWWERFGSALLLSIVGDATSVLSQRLQDQDIDMEGTTSAGKDAAAIAVEQSINIPPTLNKHQGSLVSIFVARDLDFSGIYRLRITEPRNTVYDRAVSGDFRRHSDLVTK
ncbi:MULTISPECIES: type IV secretion system protein VirB10 [unclassified Aureimonas]|uniref:type IV secretion system protein VirB10 n=1 Tax=unclassified Aureimonas TaxID=2615206 RepID=UPI0006FBE40E|nr:MULTISPECIES: type IV secretion system protein VirB10 [unclassified Aureimonas]KQT62253.1 type IV secretion system protein VirB10 [Aureimonas sp. Leaf427]KQT72511.1 type IV secretion system protein VirB10 [Aureimonas sp. Leaf460]